MYAFVCIVSAHADVLYFALILPFHLHETLPGDLLLEHASCLPFVLSIFCKEAYFLPHLIDMIDSSGIMHQ